MLSKPRPRDGCSHRIQLFSLISKMRLIRLVRKGNFSGSSHFFILGFWTRGQIKRISPKKKPFPQRSFTICTVILKFHYRVRQNCVDTFPRLSLGLTMLFSMTLDKTVIRRVCSHTLQGSTRKIQLSSSKCKAPRSSTW